MAIAIHGHRPPLFKAVEKYRPTMDGDPDQTANTQSHAYCTKLGSWTWSQSIRNQATSWNSTCQMFTSTHSPSVLENEASLRSPAVSGLLIGLPITMHDTNAVQTETQTQADLHKHWTTYDYIDISTRWSYSGTPWWLIPVDDDQHLPNDQPTARWTHSIRSACAGSLTMYLQLPRCNGDPQQGQIGGFKPKNLCQTGQFCQVGYEKLWETTKPLNHCRDVQLV